MSQHDTVFMHHGIVAVPIITSVFTQNPDTHDQKVQEDLALNQTYSHMNCGIRLNIFKIAPFTKRNCSVSRPLSGIDEGVHYVNG